MSIPFLIIDPQGNIKSNIQRFVNMTPLANQPVIGKRIRDEFDLIESLEVVRDAVHDTASMVGKRKYKNEDYNFAQQVRDDVEEYLIGGRNEYAVALAKNKNQLMHRLVIDPVIDALEQFDHMWALSNVNTIITQLIDEVLNHNLNPTLSDAEIAREETSAIIEANLQSVLQRKKARKPRVKKADKVLLVDDNVDVLEDFLPDAE